jgi:hypothetical protein
MWKEKDIQEFITNNYDTIDTAKRLFYKYVVATYPLLELISAYTFCYFPCSLC